MSRVSCLVLAGLSLLACSGGSSPLLPDVTGTWLVAQTWAGDSVSCSFTGESLFLAQTDTLLVGQMRGGGGSCAIFGMGAQQVGQATDSISNGKIRGTAISFDKTQQLHYHGAAIGSQVSGTLTGALIFAARPSKTVVLTGNWVAIKQ